MPLEAIGPMMQRAVEGGYAVGYFESWNLESLQGVVDAAEETGSPVILGFNGDFLSRPARRAAERLAWYAALGRAAAESAGFICRAAGRWRRPGLPTNSRPSQRLGRNTPSHHETVPGHFRSGRNNRCNATTTRTRNNCAQAYFFRCL